MALRPTPTPEVVERGPLSELFQVYDRAVCV
jgi:hypothetical protein